MEPIKMKEGSKEQSTRHSPWKKRLAQVCVLGLLIGYWIWSTFPDPHFTMKELGGLTPDEVIARLGPPSYDQRKDPSNTWTPEREPEWGPLQFNYYGQGLSKWKWGYHEYGVTFENNHVTSIVVGKK